MGDVVLSAGVRQNLLALQSTAHLMSLTQNRLATGKKVNSALDNPEQLLHLAVAQQPRERPQRAARLDRPGAEDAGSRRPRHHLADQAGRIRRNRSPSRRGRRRSRAPPATARSRSAATRPTKPWRAYGTAGTLANATVLSVDININGSARGTVDYTSDAPPTMPRSSARRRRPRHRS